jgi:hypothetical protein
VGNVSISRFNFETKFSETITAICGVICRTWRDASTDISLPSVLVHVMPIKPEGAGTYGNIRDAAIEVSIVADPQDDQTGAVADALCDSVLSALVYICENSHVVSFTGGVVNGLVFESTDERIDDEGHTVILMSLNATIAEE